MAGGGLLGQPDDRLRGDRELAVDDDQPGLELVDQREQAVVVHHVVVEAVDRHHVEGLAGVDEPRQLLVDVALDEAHPRLGLRLGVRRELRAHLRAHLDPDHLARPGRGQRVGPAAVVRGEIEHPGAGELIGVRADQEAVPLVEPVERQPLALVARVVREEVEERHSSTLGAGTRPGGRRDRSDALRRARCSPARARGARPRERGGAGEGGGAARPRRRRWAAAGRARRGATRPSRRGGTSAPGSASSGR